MYSIWVVVNEKGEFWKKTIDRIRRVRIDNDDGTSDIETVYPSRFTTVFGRARIFDSEKRALSYCKGNILGKVTVRAYHVIPFVEIVESSGEV